MLPRIDRIDFSGRRGAKSTLSRAGAGRACRAGRGERERDAADVGEAIGASLNRRASRRAAAREFHPDKRSVISRGHWAIGSKSSSFCDAPFARSSRCQRIALRSDAASSQVPSGCVVMFPSRFRVEFKP